MLRAWPLPLASYSLENVRKSAVCKRSLYLHRSSIESPTPIGSCWYFQLASDKHWSVADRPNTTGSSLFCPTPSRTPPGQRAGYRGKTLKKTHPAPADLSWSFRVYVSFLLNMNGLLGLLYRYVGASTTSRFELPRGILPTCLVWDHPVLSIS